MNAESLARIDEVLRSATGELFASHGAEVAVESRDGNGIEEPFAATIGFTSPSLRGALVITLGRELALRSLPASLRRGEPAVEILADWTGELSNQLLGRLKTKLFAFGIDIALSTPMVFVGKELRHFSHACPIIRSARFSGTGPCLVEFLACVEDYFEIGEPRQEETGRPPEGEAVFF